MSHDDSSASSRPTTSNASNSTLRLSESAPHRGFCGLDEGVGDLDGEVSPQVQRAAGWRVGRDLHRLVGQLVEVHLKAIVPSDATLNKDDGSAVLKPVSEVHTEPLDGCSLFRLLADDAPARACGGGCRGVGHGEGLPFGCAPRPAYPIGHEMGTGPVPCPGNRPLTCGFETAPGGASSTIVGGRYWV